MSANAVAPRAVRRAGVCLRRFVCAGREERGAGAGGAAAVAFATTVAVTTVAAVGAAGVVGMLAVALAL